MIMMEVLTHLEHRASNTKWHTEAYAHTVKGGGAWRTNID